MKFYNKNKTTTCHCEASQFKASCGNLLKSKKAAMFGLDARIALAIFGALSVITGAALYTAIGNAKAIALLTEMQEVGKAWESYYLDTGVYPPTLSSNNSDNNFYITKTTEFVTSTVSGWKGPYLSYNTSTPNILKHSKYNNVHIIKAGDGDWGALTLWSADKCTSGKQCYAWIQIDGIPDESMLKKIDDKVDGGDGSALGYFRWSSDGGSYPIYSFLRYAPIKNPND